MGQRSSAKVVTLAAVVVVVGVVGLVASNVVHIQAGMQFQRADDPEIWKLFRDGASDGEIQQAVLASGKSVVDIHRSGATLLEVAIEERRPSLMDWILTQGAPVDGPRGDGGPLKYAMGIDCEACVDVLLARGADPNAAGNAAGASLTPLEAAREFGYDKYEARLVTAIEQAQE